MRRVLALMAAAAIGSLALAALPTIAVPVSAVSPNPAFIPVDAPWLTTVNYFRSMSGLPAVTEEPTWAAGAQNHSCYMLYNNIAHDEVPGYAGYTADGDQAGNNGNVAVTSQYGATARSHIELWMTGPFHAIGVLRPNLQKVGFGKCDNPNTSPWKSGATLDVLRGLTWAARPSTPILFPGNGTTTGLDTFVTESPNPLDYCGWTGTAGLPVIAMMPEAVTSVSGSITGPNGPLQTCTIFSGNTSGVAKSILSGDNAVSVIPRSTLVPGTYTVNVTTQARNVTWSFTVDNTADTGVQPSPVTSASGNASGVQSVAPFRFADSRISQRITRLTQGIPKRIRLGGIAGLPTDITAVNANLTVVTPEGPGYLTAYDCSTQPPTASALNFQQNEVVGNAGIFPLNSSGELCVLSPVTTQLVIDVYGYARPTGVGRLNAVTPQRIINTSTNTGLTGKLQPDVTVEFDAFALGVPTGSTAVVFNLTSSNSAANGYVTIYPCQNTRPLVSMLNPRAGSARSNQAIIQVPADGRLCMYSSLATDLQVEFLGALQSNGPSYTPSVPVRLTDTRDLYRTAMNAGTGGQPLNAGQTLTVTYGGQRGIPANATAISVNVTVVGATTAGSLTVWPCGDRPSIISATYGPTRAVANGVQAKLSPAGQLCIYTTSRGNVIVDVSGWWS